MDDECKTLQLQAFDKYLKKNHFLKRTLQLVVSVSIFSLVLCCSSGFWLSFFPYSSFNVYFSTFLFSICTHTLERKYMFLICNGILAFLAKSSSRVSCSTSSPPSAACVAGDDDDDDDDQLSVTDDFPEEEARLENVESLENVALVADDREEQEQEEKKLVEEVIQEKQKGQVEDREGTEDEDEESVIADEEEEEEDNYTGEAAVSVNEPSTDELNKKIEEFIRKMKEEIRIEAQQQLIAV